MKHVCSARTQRDYKRWSLNYGALSEKETSKVIELMWDRKLLSRAAGHRCPHWKFKGHQEMQLRSGTLVGQVVWGSEKPQPTQRVMWLLSSSKGQALLKGRHHLRRDEGAISISKTLSAGNQGVTQLETNVSREEGRQSLEKHRGDPSWGQKVSVHKFRRD